MSVPALFHGEWAALPFHVLCGFLAGQLRAMAHDRDDIWSFSPFIDQSIFRLIRRNLPRPRLFDWQVMFFWTIVGLRFVQTELSRYFPSSIYSIESLDNLWVEALIYAATVAAIGIEIKVFNSAHSDQTRGRSGFCCTPAWRLCRSDQSAFPVQHSEFDLVAGALRSDTARDMIFKLATILRRLLGSSEAFAPLRKNSNLSATISTSKLSASAGKLRVVKTRSRHQWWYSMLLQPLIENSIKHGLSKDRGSIYLRSRVQFA
jgi:two-component system LytT family sensor kinase